MFSILSYPALRHSTRSQPAPFIDARAPSHLHLFILTNISSGPTAMSFDDEAEHVLLKADVETPGGQVTTKKGQPRAWAHWIVHVLLAFILLALAATRKAPCSADDSVPSLQDGLPQEALRMYPIRFNGSIDFRSRWKGIPRPELEAAWNAVTYDGGPVLHCDFTRTP